MIETANLTNQQSAYPPHTLWMIIRLVLDLKYPAANVATSRMRRRLEMPGPEALSREGTVGTMLADLRCVA
jgi:hypothetical protein